MIVAILLSLVAVGVSLSAFQSTRNWINQIEMEFRHLEKRVDNLMDLCKELSKKIEQYERK